MKRLAIIVALLIVSAAAADAQTLRCLQQVRRHILCMCIGNPPRIGNQQ